ncbi:AAA family ATPase [Spiroplasma endosymbiont of Nebria brevicollis]|uniref:AAA family ATPase n=1 Tax=Spiroplasma endosymbiont of Nebria brevicollis TaxID=3066284 RepID=UPI00313BDE97
MEYLKKIMNKSSDFNYIFKVDYDNLTNSFKDSIETTFNISHSTRNNKKKELSVIWEKQILFLFTMQDFTKHQLYILRILSKWEHIEKEGACGHDLLHNLFLSYEDSKSSRQNIKYDYENIVTDYVEPIRNAFKRFYTNNQLSDLNSTDSKSLTKLKSNQELHSKVEKFLKSSDMLSSIKIDARSIDDNIVHIPKYKKSNSNKEYKLFISGTGISQILPILTSLYDNQLNKVFMEQPEIHLHPKLQSLVGKSIFEWFIEHKDDKTLKNQLFIETHSKYLIDHIRYQIYKSNEEIILKKEKEIETISSKINLFKESKDKEKLLYFILIKIMMIQ